MTSSSLRIAVADDEADIREYLEKMLPRMGHQVVAVAENGRDLVELCRSQPPDLIISDLRMPELDGDEAVRQLSGEQTIPFIAISAFSKPNSFGAHLTPGRWKYLHKPVKRSDLDEAINDLFPFLECDPSASPSPLTPSASPAGSSVDSRRLRSSEDSDGLRGAASPALPWICWSSTTMRISWKTCGATCPNRGIGSSVVCTPRRHWSRPMGGRSTWPSWI